MLIKRLVTKNLHRLMVFGFWPASSRIYLSSTLICPDMQLPAPTHEMSGNARIVRSEAVWHEEFDATSNLRFRLGPPPHPALGRAALDSLSTFTLGTRHMLHSFVSTTLVYACLVAKSRSALYNKRCNSASAPAVCVRLSNSSTWGQSA